MYSTNKIFSLLAISMLFFSISFAQDLDTELSADSAEFHVGDTIEVRLHVYPQDNSQPIYTVSATAMYDTSLLRYEGSRFATINWFPLNRAPYVLEDTTQGMIRKTAGYPEGLKTDSDFLIYTFTAVNPGVASVSLEDGLSLQFDNAESKISPRRIFIKILPKETSATATTTAATSPNVPEGASNRSINVDLNVVGDTALYSSLDYTMSVDLPKFGDDIINTVYAEVYDQNYRTVWTKDLTYAGNSDKHIEFTIPGGTLKAGNYIVSVKAQLSNGTVEILNEKFLGVLDRQTDAFGKYSIPVYCLIAFVILFGILHHLMMDEDVIMEDRELKKMLKKNKKK